MFRPPGRGSAYHDLDGEMRCSRVDAGLLKSSEKIAYTPTTMLNRGYAYTTIISGKDHGNLLCYLASLYTHSTEGCNKN